VRLNPFDDCGRRHMAIAAVMVLPAIGAALRPEDLEVEMTERRGVACSGGQHAARLRHLPTGVTVSAVGDNRRQTRRSAETLLQAALYERARPELAPAALVRTYTFHPRPLVRDERSGAESDDLEAVLGGELELFLEVSLLRR
jgi:peptide chain release factor 2